MVLYCEFNKYYDNGTNIRQLVTSNLRLTISKKMLTNNNTRHFISNTPQSRVYRNCEA